MKEAIRKAIRDHIKAGGLVTDPEGLLVRIREAIGDKDDSWEYEGWRVERKSGAELKVRGHARYCNGWLATHIETGRQEAFEPVGTSDTPVAVVKNSLDILNKIRAKTGNF